MNNYIAICVSLSTKKKCYFLTLGDIFETNEYAEIEKIVLDKSSSFALDGKAVKAEVCYSLKDAADAPYFYECLASLLKYNAPTGKISIIKWRKNMRNKIMNGSILMYCGNPKHRESCRHKFWSMKS